MNYKKSREKSKDKNSEKQASTGTLERAKNTQFALVD